MPAQGSYLFPDPGVPARQARRGIACDFAPDASGHPMILICPNDANAQSMTHERGAQVSASRMPSPLGKRLSTPANNNEYARDAQEMM